MRRRESITFVGITAVDASTLTRAGTAAVPVIAFLNGTDPADFGAYVAAFQRGLGEVGYVEGQNVAIEYRWAEGQYGRPFELASDLIGRGVAVIVSGGGGDTVAMAAKRATTVIPIVFVSGGDPVKNGLVASLNRPGGNVTGIALLTTELEAKRLEVLRELVPSAKIIAFLVDPQSATADIRAKLLATAAKRMGSQILVPIAAVLDHLAVSPVIASVALLLVAEDPE